MPDEITENEHSVQSALLAEFSFESKKKKPRDRKIYQTDKWNPQKYEIKKIKDCEVYHELYPQTIEKELNSVIEAPGIRLIRKIRKLKKISHLSDEQTNLLIRYILVQFYRTPSFLNKLMENLQEFQNDNQDLVYDVENILKDIFNMKIHELVNNKVILDFKLGLFQNRTNIPLIISDSPAIIFDLNTPFAEFSFDFYQNGYLRFSANLDIRYKKETSILLPINPNQVLYLYNSSNFPSGNNEEYFVRDVNWRSLIHAKEFIYTHIKWDERYNAQDKPGDIYTKFESSNKKSNWVKRIKYNGVELLTKGEQYKKFLSNLTETEKIDWYSFLKRNTNYSAPNFEIMTSYLGSDLIEKIKRFFEFKSEEGRSFLYIKDGATIYDE